MTIIGLYEPEFGRLRFTIRNPGQPDRYAPVRWGVRSEAEARAMVRQLAIASGGADWELRIRDNRPKR